MLARSQRIHLNNFVRNCYGTHKATFILLAKTPDAITLHDIKYERNYKRKYKLAMHVIC